MNKATDTDRREHIIAITEEIWEQRNLDRIRAYYADDVVIHTPTGDLRGVETVVQNTAEMLHAFPDRRLLPQEIIISKEGDGWHSSHRIISVMHHKGNGVYGKASNRRVKVHTIADCALRDNQIYEEWLVRDHLAIVRQLGLDPNRFVSNQLRASRDANKSIPSHAGQSMPFTQEKTKGNISKDASESSADHSNKDSASAGEAQNYIDALHSVFTKGAFARIRGIYHPGCSLFLPGGICDYGQDAADAFFMGYAASFPGASFQAQRVSVNDEPGLPLRVAVRWTLQGEHKGQGRFGAPSGAPISILGISHANFYKGMLLDEWTLIDEISILAQIEAFKQRKK